MSLEENLAKLEETAKRLETEEISLEESFQLYQDGMELLKQCNAEIDRVEQQVLVLSGDGELEPFT